MNKIDQIQGGRPDQAGLSKKASNKGQGPSFKDILDKASSRVEGGGDSSAPAQQLGHPSQPGQVNQISALEGLTPEQADGLIRAGRTLDVLDNYVAALGDGGKSLKDMAPLVSAMDQEVEGLAQAMDKLDASDELKTLLNDVAVTAMVESIKFNRGDYLPAE